MKFSGWVVALSYVAAFALGGALGWYLTSRVTEGEVEALAEENEQLASAVLKSDSLLSAIDDTLEVLRYERDSLRERGPEIRVVREQAQEEQHDSGETLTEHLTARNDTAGVRLLDEHLRIDERVAHEYAGEVLVYRLLAMNQARQIKLLTTQRDTLRDQRDRALALNRRLVDQNRTLVQKLNPPLLARLGSFGLECAPPAAAAGLAAEDVKVGLVSGGVCVLVKELL